MRSVRIPPTIGIVEKPVEAPWNDGRPLVLILEAEESVRDLYGDWFSHLGFQVMCAVGREGLYWALRRERPQLIVTELVAGDLTLQDVMTRLQSDETRRCIPVIVLTTSYDAAAIARAKTLGVTAVLEKFADLDVLRRWVEALRGDAENRCAT